MDKWYPGIGRAAALLLAGAILTGPALASVVYRVDFYKGSLAEGLDSDGVVDYTGTFVVPDGTGLVDITSFSATIDGVSYDKLFAEGSFPGPPSYVPAGGGWPIAFIDGFVFGTLPTSPTDTVTTLQFSSFGSGSDYYSGWALSSCTVGIACGGGAYLGKVTITELGPTNSVPTPDSLSLAALGLLALAGARRRGR